RGAELAAGIQEQAGANPLKPAGCGRGLLLAQADGELLVEVRRDLGRRPGIEQRHGGLKRGELARALGARGDVGARGGVPGRSGIEQDIWEFGLAGFAVHHLVEHLRSFLSFGDASCNRLARLAVSSCCPWTASPRRSFLLTKLLQL